MFWKEKPAVNNRAHKPELFYSRLKGDIPSMRKQGEPPHKDPSSFSKHYCDLCNDTFSLTVLRQCTLCGRWACSSCWTQEFYVCNSCHGTYKLHIQPLLQSGSVENKE
ncbi:hypothetical protein [Methanogenium sp. MK-MG]|uniref:hypothetical protein n=1 Tax=Methanogenium sp. MK-MG TaxID=2599926 RepID=UPI0013EDB033|nr:hypothetical protein [Methanogenium sp. MK-MG]KAF1078858.1 hypothetical protein MKMG_00277 [Methanogenium sp. MK-MG]